MISVNNENNKINIQNFHVTKVFIWKGELGIRTWLKQKQQLPY